MICLVLFFPVIKIKKVQIQTFWFAPLIGSILLLSMFAIVLTLHSYDISKYIFDLLNNNNLILTYGTPGFVIANLINNIPMSVLYVDIIENFEVVYKEAIFTSVISSNISAFFTPIKALAGMMWMGILKKNNVRFHLVNFAYMES